jgi:hypothetical protein
MNPTYLIWQAEHWNDGLPTARADSRAELAIALSLRARRNRARTTSAVNVVGRALRRALAVLPSFHSPRPASAADNGMEVC